MSNDKLTLSLRHFDRKAEKMLLPLSFVVLDVHERDKRLDVEATRPR